MVKNDLHNLLSVLCFTYLLSCSVFPLTPAPDVVLMYPLKHF